MSTTLATTLPALCNLSAFPLSPGMPWSFAGRLPWALSGHVLRIVIAVSPAAASPLFVLDSDGHGITTAADPDDATKTLFEAALTDVQTADVPEVPALHYWWSVIQPSGSPFRIANGTIPVRIWRNDASVQL